MFIPHIGGATAMGRQKDSGEGRLTGQCRGESKGPKGGPKAGSSLWTGFV